MQVPATGSTANHSLLPAAHPTRFTAMTMSDEAHAVSCIFI
jgi:hypothetical protein